MFTKKIYLTITVFIICMHCYTQQINTLTPQEKKEGWQLLFNGKDLYGWHSYLQKKPGKAWQVEDGAIYFNKNDKSVYEDFADLTSDEEFENFDLKLEFKTDTCANSGVCFMCMNHLNIKTHGKPGLKCRLMMWSADLIILSKMNRMGTLYDLYPVDSEYVGPSGQWYEYEIKADHGHLQLFEDGHKVVDAQMWNQHWKD